MNVPLSWLAEYVKLPKDTSVLTDKLTMIGHMLDKQHTEHGETVIDLELRGNRSDLFGLIGIARDIQAAFHTPRTLPATEKLPIVDKTSSLVTVKAKDLVERFYALTLHVTVGPSPEWMQKRLALYGIASINNVVDITNYVMVETGEPMHAFDLALVKGKRLILRRAHDGEEMITLNGQTITLTPEDLAVCDEEKVQALTMIGSKTSGVTNETTDILLEAATYDQGNVRRSSRRLKIRTEAGTRHEKLLDPNQVPFALSRALYLLKEHAHAKVTSKSCDQYIQPRTASRLTITEEDVQHLSGLTISTKDIAKILTDLECTVTETAKNISTTVPTFRTDITETADLVEEIARIVGYEHIPTIPLAGMMTVPQSSPSVVQEDFIKNTLQRLQINEVITSSIVDNTYLSTFAPETPYASAVTLVNPPDPAIATLRPSLLPNLTMYAKRLLSARTERIALYEIGRIYNKHNKKSQTPYSEQRVLGIILTGKEDVRSWNRSPRELSLFDIKGIIESLCESLDCSITIIPGSMHPSLDPANQGAIMINKTQVGSFGVLHPGIATVLGLSNVYAAELILDTLPTIPPLTTGYQVTPPFPPMIEDISLTLHQDIHIGELLTILKKIDPLITDIKLFDAYQNKRTIRIIYSDPTKTLTSEDIKPIREKIIAITQKNFQAELLAK